MNHKHFRLSTHLHYNSLDLQKIDQKYLKRFEMLCWGRAEKISWSERVKNEKVLDTDTEEGNDLHKIKRRKTNLIGHILLMIYLIKAFFEGKIEGTERRGRRYKQLLDDHQETVSCWNLNKEALGILRAYARTIPSAVCVTPPEDEQVMLETCRGS
jgi:hypothetical protein